MKRHISWLSISDNWELIFNISLLAISIPMIVVPVVKGYRSGIQYLIEWLGLFLLFKAIIFLIEKPRYFLYMLLLFILLFVFLITDGFGTGLLGKLGEDIAFTCGFFCIAGIFASVVGYFLKR